MKQRLIIFEQERQLLEIVHPIIEVVRDMRGETIMQPAVDLG